MALIVLYTMSYLQGQLFTEQIAVIHWQNDKGMNIASAATTDALDKAV